MTDTYISNYISNTDSDIYAIYNLPEEVIAVLFAYYSRSEGSLKENLQKLIEDEDILTATNFATFANASEKARKFHEKWVLAYGHSSVAEHCMVHMAVENISMLAAKAIEDCRLASYTEKSTRYVDYRTAGYVIPPELQGEALEAYKKHCDNLFEFYSKAVDSMKAKFLSEGATVQEAKAKACDVCRNILPASAKTNLGMTVNARELAHMISKLLSNSSKEINEIGEKIKEEALKVCPTLLKYAERSKYLFYQNSCKNICKNNKDKDITEFAHPQTSVWYMKDGGDYEEYPITDLTDELTIQLGTKFPPLYILSERGPHDSLPRAAEKLIFEGTINIDFGAYRDIQRHRLGTLISDPISPYEYFVIDEIKQNENLSNDMQFLINKSKDIYFELYKINHDCNILQYCLPMCFGKNVSFTWNLRELCHFIELRSKPQGHKNYRHVAQELHRQLKEICPETASLVRCSYEK